MTLNTSILFQLQVRLFRPELICDVGSMDAAAARRFRRLSPHTHMIALEANPHNVKTMRADRRNVQLRREIQQKAAWNRNGTIKFCVEHLARPDGWDPRRNISSTRKRKKGSLGHTAINVDAMRLDTFVGACANGSRTVALWIDVEGAAFEVLEGIEGIRERVQIVHVKSKRKDSG